MPEGAETDPLLELRFHPTEESLHLMRDMKDALPMIQRGHPSIQGLGFFGSRTKGQEDQNKQSGKVSDLDMFIFINDNTQRRTEDWFKLEDIRKLLPTHVPIHLDSGDVHIMDISQNGLDFAFGNFTASMNDIVGTSDVLKPEDIVRVDSLREVFPLTNLFLLAVGDPVYEARKYILDKFKAYPGGERYFQLLMRKLAHWERRTAREKDKHNSPDFLHYPKTIEAAEIFFITQQYSMDRLNPPDTPEKADPSPKKRSIREQIRDFLRPEEKANE